MKNSLDQIEESFTSSGLISHFCLNPQVNSPLFTAVLLLLQPIHFRGGRPGLPAWGFKCIGIEALLVLSMSGIKHNAETSH